VTDQVSHPYKRTGKIIYLTFFIETWKIKDSARNKHFYAVGNYCLVRKCPSIVFVFSRLQQYRGNNCLPDKSVLEFRMIRCVEVIRNTTAVGVMWRDIHRASATEVWRRAGTGRIGSMGGQKCSSPGVDRNPTVDVTISRATAQIFASFSLRKPAFNSTAVKVMRHTVLWIRWFGFHLSIYIPSVINYSMRDGKWGC
jgi:hypothetical protein